MKKRIAYCLPSLYIPGGMERVLTIKANYFADVLGYEVYIILTDGKTKPVYFELSPKVKLINFGLDFDEMWKLPFHHKIVVYLKKQRLYKKLLKKQLMNIHPDITVSMLRREINFINRIKDGSSKIGEIHVSKENFRTFEKEETNFVKAVFSSIWTKQSLKELRKLKRLIVLSGSDKKKWEELHNVEVIPNPLPFYPAESSDCTKHKVITVGRYDSIKGFDRLIDAWVLVNKKHPDWELHIYGGGERAPYQTLVNQKGIEDSFFCEPAEKNITEKYLESSIFALSSRYEGFGMVIAEAMACGVPAVSFDCPSGPRDIIRNGEDGFLVENGNIEKLAEKICYLIEHDDLRKDMGKKAKKNIERLKIEYVARQWTELFDKIS